MNVNISATKNGNIHPPTPPQIVPCMSVTPQMPGGSFSFFVQRMPWLKQVGTHVQIDPRLLFQPALEISFSWAVFINVSALTFSFTNDRNMKVMDCDEQWK